jgi:hypothetical protein
MANLRLIHDFLKDPLTDKLFRKYVTDSKARRVFDTSLRLVEIAIIAMPLAVTAAKSVRDLAKGSTARRAGSRIRRLVAA